MVDCYANSTSGAQQMRNRMTWTIENGKKMKTRRRKRREKEIKHAQLFLLVVAPSPYSLLYEVSVRQSRAKATPVYVGRVLFFQYFIHSKFRRLERIKNVAYQK